MIRFKMFPDFRDARTGGKKKRTHHKIGEKEVAFRSMVGREGEAGCPKVDVHVPVGSGSALDSLRPSCSGLNGPLSFGLEIFGCLV